MGRRGRGRGENSNLSSSYIFGMVDVGGVEVIIHF